MKVFIGKVVSKKMDKTATVMVERVVVHPIYLKRYKRTKKYQIHDELGTNVGDKVKFSASKPYSKLKRWKIVEIVKVDKKLTKSGKKRSKK
ncbi:30S ribosomal protein S17 [Patescibacteria group bacterium]|nr:30S ribosomal protein S17 [Patescibacteria group bacterium]